MSARCTDAAVQVSHLSWKSVIEKLDWLRSTLAILSMNYYMDYDWDYGSECVNMIELKSVTFW
jgi:hypothetical protein